MKWNESCGESAEATQDTWKMDGETEATDNGEADKPVGGNDVCVAGQENFKGSEAEELALMQRKRGRPETPRRRRRARAERQEERQRQERRHSWQIDAANTRARTATCSRRPLVAPWSRGQRGRAGPSRPSAAPMTAAPGSSMTPLSSSAVPDIPPLGDGAGNIVWWSEMLGLQDPMMENDRVLENQTVECLVENLRAMSPHKRTAMVAQIVPFLGALAVGRNPSSH